ncbi:polyprenyl synthetase family protein [Metabacillus sp. HB246100]|uniref:polyprenyl synthetase family protein n=1 Tax=Bacillus weihaiensis TaxID=1547283 RepID=UPI0023577C07|nr:polyprenyl synthetase family protein [Bacillus weihaiensis]
MINLIHQEMNHLIVSKLTNSGLKELLLSFIAHKKALNFAQLTWTHYQAFGGKGEQIYTLAAAVELLILSFDILDDLEDQDNTEEPWMQLDYSLSLNAATTLYTLSQSAILTLHSSHKVEIYQSFLMYSLLAMEGQHDDLENNITSEEHCIQTMKLKSGSLIALASVCGMQLAGKYDAKVEEYSYEIGLAAQTENDFRDLFNPHKKDSSSKKQSLAYLYLQKKYNNHSNDLFLFYNSKQDIQQFFGSLESYKQKLLNAGILQYLNVIKQVAINRAARIIDSLNLDQDQIDRIKSTIL